MNSEITHATVILSAAKDPLRRVKRELTTWILRCAQDDGAGNLFPSASIRAIRG